MRVQFNARTYVVEPVYRDDGLGLWDFGDQAPAQDDTVELMVEAARIERRDEASEPDRRREEAEPAGDAVGRARRASCGRTWADCRHLSRVGLRRRNRTAGLDHGPRSARGTG